MAAPRYIEKFESIDASISLTFPLFRYEYEASQPVAHASAPTAGATYDFDHLGLALAPLRNGAERIRFLLVGDEDDLDNDLDDIKSKLYLAGRGKLYLLDALGNRRWAYARIADMPGVTLTAGRHRILPVTSASSATAHGSAPAPATLRVRSPPPRTPTTSRTPAMRPCTR